MSSEAFSRTHGDSPSLNSASDEVLSMDLAEDRTLINAVKVRSGRVNYVHLICFAVFTFLVLWFSVIVIVHLLRSREHPSPSCQLSSKATLASPLIENGTLYSKTFSTNAILKSDHQFIDVVVNLTIKFRSATNDSSVKAIIVECGDISKVLMTSKQSKMAPILHNAIVDRFGGDFNRAKAALDGYFPLELRLGTSVCDSIFESKGKLLLADEIERSWYRRKILAPEDASWSDNVTIHWMGLDLMDDQTVSCILTKQRSPSGDCGQGKDSN